MKAYERVQKSLKTPKTLDEIIVDTGLSKKQIINAFAYLSRRGVDVQAEPTVYYIGRPRRGLFERILKGRWK